MSGRPRSWVLMVPANAFLQMIIDIMGYHHYCASTSVRCQLHYGAVALPLVDFFPLRHGMGLTLEVHHDTPRPSEGSWDDEDEAIDLLQRTSSRKTLTLEEIIPMQSQDALQMAHVRLFSAVDYLKLPDFIVIAEPCTPSSVESELLQWGHHCRCWIDCESASAICWPVAFLCFAAILSLRLDRRH